MLNYAMNSRKTKLRRLGSGIVSGQKLWFSLLSVPSLVEPDMSGGCVSHCKCGYLAGGILLGGFADLVGRNCSTFPTCTWLSATDVPAVLAQGFFFSAMLAQCFALQDIRTKLERGRISKCGTQFSCPAEEKRKSGTTQKP